MPTRWRTSMRRSARIRDSYPHGPLDDEAAFTRWFELPMDQLIDEVIADARRLASRRDS